MLLVPIAHQTDMITFSDSWIAISIPIVYNHAKALQNQFVICDHITASLT